MGVGFRVYYETSTGATSFVYRSYLGTIGHHLLMTSISLPRPRVSSERDIAIARSK